MLSALMFHMSEPFYLSAAAEAEQSVPRHLIFLLIQCRTFAWHSPPYIKGRFSVMAYVRSLIMNFKKHLTG